MDTQRAYYERHADTYEVFVDTEEGKLRRMFFDKLDLIAWARRNRFELIDIS